MISRQGEKRRTLDLQLIDQRVDNIDDVSHALLVGSRIVDIAKMNNGVGREFFQRLPEQGDVIGHLGAPVADHHNFARTREPVVDHAVSQVGRRLFAPVVVLREARLDRVPEVLPEAPDPADNVPFAIAGDQASDSCRPPARRRVFGGLPNRGVPVADWRVLTQRPSSIVGGTFGNDLRDTIRLQLRVVCPNQFSTSNRHWISMTGESIYG